MQGHEAAALWQNDADRFTVEGNPVAALWARYMASMARVEANPERHLPEPHQTNLRLFNNGVRG